MRVVSRLDSEVHCPLCRQRVHAHDAYPCVTCGASMHAACAHELGPCHPETPRPKLGHDVELAHRQRLQIEHDFHSTFVEAAHAYPARRRRRLRRPRRLPTPTPRPRVGRQELRLWDGIQIVGTGLVALAATCGASWVARAQGPGVCAVYLMFLAMSTYLAYTIGNGLNDGEIELNKGHTVRWSNQPLAFSAVSGLHVFGLVVSLGVILLFLLR